MSKRRQRRAQLRSLECLAFSSSLSFLRTSNESEQTLKSVTEQLQAFLKISSHRHRAELKRILNDEDLEVFSSAKNLAATNSSRSWIEIDEKLDEQEQKLGSTTNNSSFGYGPTKKKVKTIHSN